MGGGNFLLACVNANVDEPIDLQSTNIVDAAGRDGNVFWRRDVSKYLTLWTNSDEAFGGFDPPVPNLNTNKHYAGTATAVASQREELLHALHFGIAVLKPNTITWDGLNFEGIDTLGRKIKGELTVENGHPAQLRFKYEKDGGVIVINMEYQKPFPFPSRMVSTYITKGNAKKPLAEYKISSFVASSSPLPDVVRPTCRSSARYSHRDEPRILYAGWEEQHACERPDTSSHQPTHEKGE